MTAGTQPCSPERVWQLTVDKIVSTWVGVTACSWPIWSTIYLPTYLVTPYLGGCDKVPFTQLCLSRRVWQVAVAQLCLPGRVWQPAVDPAVSTWVRMAAGSWPGSTGYLAVSSATEGGLYTVHIFTTKKRPGRWADKWNNSDSDRIALSWRFRKYCISSKLSPWQHFILVMNRHGGGRSHKRRIKRRNK
jgi:hypothetical protein